MKNQVTPGLYRHFKGHTVRVLGIALHSENEEAFVVYDHMGTNPKSNLWVRPITMFLENVTVDGKQIQRFTRL